ncbi:MAG: hybrid sensor histidine kinase/response regulator [Magnetococcales bacterium]|nr:hybrid sensor histidine kinase/response regulator [Magnetococcales bacterium]
MKILIVDDNTELRMVQASALAQLGWQSEQAEHGMAALRIYKAKHAQLDAILLDQMMPDMEGLQLLPKLLAINPQATVIMMTAHASIPLVTEFMRQGGSGFIEKPITHFLILKLRIEEAIQQAGHKRALEEMRIAQRTMQQLNQEKDAFLSNLSHELRTPLTAILQFADLARRKWTAEQPLEAMAMLDMLLASKTRLLNFVTNIEYLARLHTGQLPCHPVTDRLMPLLESVLQEMRQRSAPHNLQWSVVGDPSLQAHFDAAMLRTALVELADNARQFSPEGGRIDFVVTESESQVKLAILDAGPGIPEAELEAIFAPFTASSRTRSDAGGRGLGLAVARGLLHLQGGTVWAANRPASPGALFTVLLAKEG